MSGWCGPWLAGAVLSGWWLGWSLFELGAWGPGIVLAVSAMGWGLFRVGRWRRAAEAGFRARDSWTFPRVGIRASGFSTGTVLLLTFWILLGALGGIRAAIQEDADRPPQEAGDARLFWLRVTDEVRSGERIGWQGRVLASCADSWLFYDRPWRVRGWDRLPVGLYLVGGKLRTNRRGSQGLGRLQLHSAYQLPDAASGHFAGHIAESVPVRHRLARAWASAMRPPAGELAAWTILGVPPRDRTSWKKPFLESGTAHLLAISGLHLGLLVIGLGTGLRLISGGRSSPIWTLAALGVYGTWIGWPASVRRAGLMTAFSLSGPGWGRYGRVWNGLGWAVAVLPLVDPSSPHLAGFLFSASATVGVLLGGEWAQHLLRRGWTNPRADAAPEPANTPAAETKSLGTLLFRGKQWLGTQSWFRAGASAFGASVGASLLTAPATFWVAGWLPIAGVAINLLAIPIMAIVFPVLVFASLLATFGWVGSGPLTTAAEVLSAYLIACVDVSAVWGRNTPWAGSENWAGAWGGTVLCGGLLWGLTRLGGASQLWVSCALATVVLSPGHRTMAPLDVTWLAVGQGDSVLIEVEGSRWLFDVGPPGSPAPVVRALLDRGVVRIDRVWISHGDLDHWGGWEDLFASPIRVDTLTLATPGREHFPERFWEAIANRGEKGSRPFVDWVERGDDRPLGPHHVGRVLHPGPSLDRSGEGPRGTVRNSVSVVLSLCAVEAVPDQALVLLTADLGQEQEAEVLGHFPNLEAIALHAGHHGSGGSTSRTWLEALRPGLAIISAGEGNRYGLPDLELLGRLSESGVATLRTDQEGEISLRWLGTTPTVHRPCLTFSETDR